MYEFLFIVFIFVVRRQKLVRIPRRKWESIPISLLLKLTGHVILSKKPFKPSDSSIIDSPTRMGNDHLINLSALVIAGWGELRSPRFGS